MNKIYLIFFTLITSTTLYSQTPDTSLTKKNVKELFKTDFNYVCCGETDPVWSVCFNNDGNYVTLDTIQLYSDKYHYLKGNCCNIVNWTFTNKSTITFTIGMGFK